MKLYGITGGIGSGKSVAMQSWLRLGWPAVDTDEIARDLVEPGSDALEEISREFGSKVLSVSGV
ncbi:MAG: dephospho-CoA kinase, partial [Verrucomicrobia bacterium]|nr:dephospho-CoA kinase [Verrucomicrobiota bacterium]